MSNTRYWAVILTAVAIVVVGCSMASRSASIHPTTLFVERFDATNRLLTNEYAYWNSSRHDAVPSSIWEMTSGSLFIKDRAGWTGVPDNRSPDAHSRRQNDSAIFRLTTKRHDFGDVTISMRLRPLRLVQTPTTPPVDWDGVHVFVHYQTQQSLYYVSVYRRDGHIDIKKKVPGGNANGGTYLILASSTHGIAANVWTPISVTVRTTNTGAVHIDLRIAGRRVLSATDSGTAGPPIRVGKVGLRGDNCEFLFDDFAVTQP